MYKIEKKMNFYHPPDNLISKSLKTEQRILVGTGPSTVNQNVLNVMSRPLMGPTSPLTFALMDEIKDGCRYIFQTKNSVTLCLSTSGHGGMEASLSNLIEINDVVLIGVTGLWGQRAADMAERYGADVRILKPSICMALSLEEIENGLVLHKPKLLFLVHGDTTTGVFQSLDGVGELCHRLDCLLVVDAVSTVGGTYFHGDRWQIDVMYTTSQKVLCSAPGITPISFSDRAMQKINGRKRKSCVYYWDVTVLGDHWGCFDRPRMYHHTLSATLLYALREALAFICREGLQRSIDRHIQSSNRLQAGIKSLGLEMYVDDVNKRFPTINVVKVPEGINSQMVIDYALKKYSLEIADGLGPTKGKVFRIGLMGNNSRPEMVDLILNVLKESIEQHKLFA